MAEGLARAGHRVVVVEQTETPDMLKERNQQRKLAGQKADGVVRREKVRGRREEGADKDA
eukprot:176429-Chlamydomonas_euryale.AAC.2